MREKHTPGAGDNPGVRELSVLVEKLEVGS